MATDQGKTSNLNGLQLVSKTLIFKSLTVLIISFFVLILFVILD